MTNVGVGTMNRRDALARMATLAAASGLPFGFDAASAQLSAAVTPWQAPTIPPIKAAGYGQDPNLLHPAPAPWPNTLSKAQLKLVSMLADIVIPADGNVPAATGVGVPAVIDEWVSAPYPMQQAHRQLLLTGFRWLDAEAHRRFSSEFVPLTQGQQLQIVDDIAFPDTTAANTLSQAQQFFDVFRRLVAGAFYTSAEGTRDLGYQGNVAIAGDYPGPSKAALQHLDAQLKQLGLVRPPTKS